jgi:hypothetical protein
MAQATASNPISDLMYDWFTVLQSKAEGLNAYEKYIQDAEEAGADECVNMLRKLYDQDAKMLQQVKDHVYQMIRQKG